MSFFIQDFPLFYKGCSYRLFTENTGLIYILLMFNHSFYIYCHFFNLAELVCKVFSTCLPVVPILYRLYGPFGIIRILFTLNYGLLHGDVYIISSIFSSIVVMVYNRLHISRTLTNTHPHL